VEGLADSMPCVAVVKLETDAVAEVDEKSAEMDIILLKF
jgi:hypothetical protein